MWSCCSEKEPENENELELGELEEQLNAWRQTKCVISLSNTMCLKYCLLLLWNDKCKYFDWIKYTT